MGSAELVIGICIQSWCRPDSIAGRGLGSLEAMCRRLTVWQCGAVLCSGIGRPQLHRILWARRVFPPMHSIALVPDVCRHHCGPAHADRSMRSSILYMYAWRRPDNGAKCPVPLAPEAHILTLQITPVSTQALTYQSMMGTYLHGCSSSPY